MDKEMLRKEFKEYSYVNWENDDGEPDIDYVHWLEREVISLRTAVASNNNFDADSPAVRRSN